MIGQLLPTRDYGERTYAEVVALVESGALIISEGTGGVPALRDANTHLAVKGSGKPPIKNPHDWSRSEVRRRFSENFEAFWGALVEAAIVDKNPKALELAFKYGIGDHREHGSDRSSQAMEVLLALTQQQPIQRVVTIDS